MGQILSIQNKYSPYGPLSDSHDFYRFETYIISGDHFIIDAVHIPFNGESVAACRGYGRSNIS